jgi:hypothetical protein
MKPFVGVLFLLTFLPVNGAWSGASTVPFRQYRTSVTPEAGETLQGPCFYQFLLPVTRRSVRAMFVIFDRGWQFGNLYRDPLVVDFAANHQLGLLLAQHCRSKQCEDMNIVPEHGIERALLTELKQLAADSHHTELGRCPLIFFSFSGGGSLVARMAAYTPART